MASEDGKPIVQEDNTLALFLGLYLLILAFFILLVSISTLEEVKTKTVMDSLSSTFSTVIPPSTELQAFRTDDGEVIAGQRFQERITGMFATSLQVAKVEVVQPGRLMRIEVPANALFEPNSAEVREIQRPLLDRMVAAISARPPGVRYDMEFIIGSRYTKGSKTLPIAQTLELARTGGIARELLSRGVPPDSISVGIKPGDPEQITIWYYIRDAEDSKLQFGETVGERFKKSQAEREKRRAPPESSNEIEIVPPDTDGAPISIDGQSQSAAPQGGASIPLPLAPIREP